MDKRKLIYGLLILVIGIGVFASVHLYALSKVEKSMNLVQQGIGYDHMATFRDQTPLVLSAENPTDIPVEVQLNSIVVSYDRSSVLAAPLRKELIVKPGDRVEIRFSAYWLPPEPPAVIDLNVTGDIALSASYLWVDGSMESTLNLIKQIQKMQCVACEGKKMIEVKDITKEFNGVTALNGVSFQVNEGEVFAYLGPNGAGKTITVNILATLLFHCYKMVQQGEVSSGSLMEVKTMRIPEAMSVPSPTLRIASHSSSLS